MKVMNNEHVKIVAKVLVLDDESEALRHFCEQANLARIRPQRHGAAGVLGVLKSNVDLGGILIGEGYLGDPESTFALAAEIRKQRPELPIFLRRSDESVELGPRVASMFRQSYTLDRLDELSQGLSSHIFSRIYPNSIARGIREISINALSSIFRRFDVDAEAPYLVFDRIIHGEVFTLIGIEADWCRGYMTWQGRADNLNRLVQVEYPEVTNSFREINQYLGELTNLVWGGFKNRFVGSGGDPSRTQVPIIINTLERFISFGSEDPQLCFKFNLTPKDPADGLAPISLYQRFVFNLSWKPEDFREAATVDSLVASGELEMF